MRIRLAAFLWLGLLLFACSNQDEPIPLVGDWKLNAYGPANFLQPAVPEVEAVINFNEDGSVNGSLGCNHFGGEYKLKRNQITFDHLASTLMACTDPQMLQEQAAFLILSKTVTFTIEGNTLTITDGGDILVFEILKPRINKRAFFAVSLTIQPTSHVRMGCFEQECT